MNRLFSFLLALFIGISAQAQVAVAPLTADQAVQALLGPNVIYSNPIFTGQIDQLGLVTGLGSPTSFEIASGIVLGSDEVGYLAPGFFGPGLTPNIGGDPDLLTVANSVPPLIGQTFSVGSINNQAFLEFDFVANGDALSFNYIFGSDEYLAWVNSSFNDVFAFFLSGPGLVGPYASPPGFPDGAVNIAYIPNTNPQIPITISSVNNVLNNEYYIDNPNQLDVALNGYTVTLQAQSTLICGETYHIKLAIADGTDQALKSIVCLQEGSFNIANTLIEPITINAAPGFPEASVLESCIDGQFVISPPPCLGDPLVVDIQFSGSATFGTDYSTGGVTQITLEPNSTDTLNITTIADNLPEGTESITISFTYINVLNVLDTATATLFLIDYSPTVVAPIEDIFICPGTFPSVTATPIGGYPPFAYLWSSGQMVPTVQYMQGSAGDYTVTIVDFCLNSSIEPFSVIEPDPFVVLDSTDICLGALSEVLASGGALPYVFTYDNTALENTQGTLFRGLASGEYVIAITDACNQSQDVYVTVTECDTTIPNIFTPNKDGKNDTFQILGLDGFPKSALRVYNRWGTLVYENDNYKNNWTGDDLADGVYFYVFKRADGNNYEGHLEILRK